MYYVISVRPVLQTEAKTGPFHFLFVDSLTPFFTIPYSWVRFLLSARRKQDTHLGTLRASTDNSQKQVWKYQVTVGKSQIYFLYLCCKVSFTLSFPCNNQIIFFPTLKSLSPSYIKSRGIDSALYPSPPPPPRKSGVAPLNSMNLLKICIDVTEANLVQRSELQFPWQQAAVSEA